MKTILHLCADIGSDSKVWADDGYNVIKVGKDIGVENFTPPENVFGVIANPVCTEFSTANSFSKVGDFNKGMFLVEHCLRIIKQCNPSWHYIENPANGHLDKFLGKPDFVFQPWEFGSPWTKKTALWGSFNKPKKLFTKWADVGNQYGLYIKKSRDKPSLADCHYNDAKKIREFETFLHLIKDDMSIRSMCSQGFAKQFKEAQTNDRAN